MQSRNEPHWTVIGPAGENCSYQGHHRHHLQDVRQIVVDGWNVIPQQRVQRFISRLLLRPVKAVVTTFGGSTRY